MLLAAASLLASCSSLTIQGVDFGWPVESVLTVDSNNRIEERRYGVTMRIAPIAEAEFKDSTGLLGSEVRLLRSTEGFYFLTAKRFKNVYVFAPGVSELTLRSTILVATDGLREPAMNQRPPYVELLDGSAPRKLLSADGIMEGITP
jgi:hypothetical protein